MQDLQFPAQRHFSAWASNCQESNHAYGLNFQPPWPISQTLRCKNAIFTCTWNHSVLQNGELSFPNGKNSSSQYFFFQNPKYQFILFDYTNAFLCAKFGGLKPTIDENRCPQNRNCFWARRRNKISQGNCDFISTKCFTNVNRSSGSTDCAAENSKPLSYASGQTWGPTKQKLRKSRFLEGFCSDSCVL